MIKKISKLIIVILFIFVISNVCYAQMSSVNYKVPKDVLNQTGGTSQSDNYMILHSLGESSIGYMSSTNFQLDSGFIQSEEEGFLSFTISKNSISFGTFSTSTVSTDNLTLTTSTSSTRGYAIFAYDNTQAGIANGLIDGTKKIADATTPNIYIDLPSAGTEHYGVKVTGLNADAGYATGTKINSMDNTTWIDIASYNSFIEDDEQTVEFRVSISEITPAGSDYKATSTFVCVGKY